jgi:hypothetical protein
LVEKEKLDSFNLPVYAASVNEVKAVVAQSEVFDINHINLFETSWDPHGDLEGDEIQNSTQSGINVSKSLRAVLGPLLASHFGESFPCSMSYSTNLHIMLQNTLRRKRASTFSLACPSKEHNTCMHTYIHDLVESKVMCVYDAYGYATHMHYCASILMMHMLCIVVLCLFQCSTLFMLDMSFFKLN